MTAWDTINAAFELLTVLMIAPTIYTAYRTKLIVGIHWLTPMFFMLWSVWNVIWYPHLHQWWSFAGALPVAAGNIIWIIMVLRYTQKNVTDQLSPSDIARRFALLVAEAEKDDTIDLSSLTAEDRKLLLFMPFQETK